MQPTTIRITIIIQPTVAPIVAFEICVWLLLDALFIEDAPTDAV